MLNSDQTTNFFENRQALAPQLQCFYTGSVEKLEIFKSKLDGRYYAGYASDPDNSPGGDSLRKFEALDYMFVSEFFGFTRV